MKRMLRRFALLILAAACAGSAGAQNTNSASPPAASAPATEISDFAWLQGRWTGTLGDAQVEQYFSPVIGGVIVGVFRLMTAGQPPLLEFSMLRETADGVELRVRHFDPKLKPMEHVDPIVLKLASGESNKFVFENPVNGEPKRSILEIKGEGWFEARSEIVHDNGSSSTIEVDWHRQSRELPGEDGATAGSSSPGAAAKDAFASMAWCAGHWQSPFGTDEVHEFWLAPGGNVMAGVLCAVEHGKVGGCEVSTLVPEDGVLVGRTWQLGPEMKITADQSLIRAWIVSGTNEPIDFRGTVGKGAFKELVEHPSPGRMRKKLEIFNADGAPAGVIELNATRTE